MSINNQFFINHLPEKTMKCGISLLFMLKLLLITIHTPAHTAPIPDRYQGDLPKTGYFGRMQKVLYSADASDTTIATNILIKSVFGLMDMKAEIKFFEDIKVLKHDLSNNLIDAAFVNIFDFFAMEHLVSVNATPKPPLFAGAF